MGVSRRWRVSLLTIIATVGLLPAVPAAGAATVQPVLDGLRNPRGVYASPDGTVLHIAEAGNGGDDCIQPESGDEEFQVCFGHTGRISRVVLDGSPAREDVATGLPSYDESGPEAEEFDGAFAAGPHDVWLGSDSNLYVPIGLGNSAAGRDAWEGDRSTFGTLQRINPATGNTTTVADLAAYEDANNPDGGEEPDSNPYSVYAGTPDEGILVVDAGGNDVLRVAYDDGAVSTVTTFPPTEAEIPSFIGVPPGTIIPAEPVPTSIRPDGNGSFVVGELTGFPFEPGAAHVWTMDSAGDKQVRAMGLTQVVDVAVGPDGNLYALELSYDSLLLAEQSGELPGALVRIRADGTKEVLVAGLELFAPGGMAFVGDDLYVTTCSICPGNAEQSGALVRIADAVGAEPLFTVANDTAETSEDVPVALDVLGNDSEDLTIVDVSANREGATVVTSGQDAVIYQPAAHFVGNDFVHYRACTEAGACAVGVARVTVKETETDRVAGATRLETAARVSRAVYPAGAGTVVIARSDDYADALTGSVLAGSLQAPVLLTPPNELAGVTAEEITRLGATTAYVLGGTAAISENVVNAIKAVGPDQVVRVGGANRFETAAKIKETFETVGGTPATAVFVAEGIDPDPTRGFPDALSVSPLATRAGHPILLVSTEALPDATRSALEGVQTATIVGGSAAVSDAVARQIAGVADTVERRFGADRYETSRVLAESAIDAGLDPSLVWLARGDFWPDALSAGPSVAVSGGVMILVAPDDLGRSRATRDFLAERTPFVDIDLLGGTAAISRHVEQQVRGIANVGAED